MNERRAPRDEESFGEGQNGGERLEIEQGGRHGQPEKGDRVRTPGPGGAGYRAEPRRGKGRKNKTPRS